MIFFESIYGTAKSASRWIFAILAGLATFQTTASAKIAEKLKYLRPVEKGGAPSSLAAVRLDKTIYEHIADFSDIRLLDTNGTEIPFRVRLLRKTKPKTIKTTRTATIISLKRLPDNKIEIVVKNPDKNRIPVSLTIRTPNKNYDKKISISTAPNQKGKWTPFGGEHSIFDYSAIIALSNDNAPLPSQPTGRFYKITVSNFSETKQSKRMALVTERRSGKEFSEIKKVMRFDDEFKIDSVALNFEKKIEAKDAPVTEPAESAIIANSNVKKNTIVVLNTFKQPIVEMKLSTPSVNFNRQWTLKSSNDRKEWLQVSSGGIEKIRVGSYARTTLKLHFQETRSRYLKLIIRNQDAPPIKIDGVECRRNAYAVEFIVPPKGGDSLKLYYGGDLPEPRYDIEAVLSKLTGTDPTFLKLGAETPNPAYSPGKSEENSFWTSKTMMYVVIGVVCLFLLLLLTSGFRKIDDIPES